MSVIDKLAASLNRRDEVPNQLLAQEIAANKDGEAVKELVDNLANKNKDIQSDCIKVLYEIGALKTELISPYAKDFVALLDNKNNRLQWGAMTALNSITATYPETVYSALGKLATVAEKGSVITRDNYVGILIKLSTVAKYSGATLALLNEQLLKSAVNQLPMYAENALPVIDEQHKALFIETLTARLDEMDKESKRKRVEKVLKKLAKN